MMNSPWAMLMTFIWPNVKVSPSAINRSVAPMLRPVKSWDRKLPITASSVVGPSRRPLVSSPRCCSSRAPLGEALRPVVPLQVGIRLDRASRARYLLDEPVGLDDADPGRLVQVLGGAVDGHRPLGGGPGQPGRRRPHGLHVGCARLVDRR